MSSARRSSRYEIAVTSFCQDGSTDAGRDRKTLVPSRRDRRRLDVFNTGFARGIRQNLFDEGIDDLGLAFSFDFEHIKANITHETLHVVERRNPAHCFTKEYALNDSAYFEISSLAHGRLSSNHPAVSSTSQPYSSKGLAFLTSATLLAISPASATSASESLSLTMNVPILK